MLPAASDTDWDSPLSWDADAAVAAVAELCATGRTAVPVYEISTSSITGRAEIGLDGAPLFIAEGIFAADIVARCANSACSRTRCA